MRLYVAGASSEVSAIAGYIARLEAGGVSITYNWTVDLLACQARGETDADLSQEERETARCLCLKGVELADYFWLIVPNGASIGAWVELGYAIRCRATVIASGPSAQRTIFTEYTTIVATHEEALTRIIAISAASSNARKAFRK
jgi:hypothetical protein